MLKTFFSLTVTLPHEWQAAGQFVSLFNTLVQMNIF